MNSLLLLLLSGADKVPAPADVKAGWLAFGVFIGLALAVALLGFSMTRHLRKAKYNADQGAFGPTDETRTNSS